MKKRTGVLLLVLLLAITAACSSGGSPVWDSQEQVREVDEPTTTTTLPTAPEATTPAPFGTIQEIAGGTAAVFDYVQPIATDELAPVDVGFPESYVWAALDIEVCVATQTYVSTYPWRLIMPDNSFAQSSDWALNAVQPAYPFEQAVADGQCVRGWITFIVPGDSWPTGVQYTIEAGVLNWSVDAP